MELRNQPSIHIWIYNHFLETVFTEFRPITRRLKARSFSGISDQLEFFISSLKQHGYTVSLGKEPSSSALNVVIENFSAHTRDVLTAYCQATKKRVAVIMTEHLDFINNEIFIHGEKLLNRNDYMHPVTQFNRIKYLMDCLPYIRCFFVLGDLPELRNMSKVLPGVDVRAIPFPRIDLKPLNEVNLSELIQNDLLFTGKMTHFRTKVLALLKGKGFSMSRPTGVISRKRRDLTIRSTKLTLNVPQRQNWRWLSLMRNIAALRSGRATVSLGNKPDDSKISACTFQLDLNDHGWPDVLKQYIEIWPSLYEVAHENYTTMANEYEQLNKFPHDMFEYWAITDQVTLHR
jgi:hypothetical protein